jgi:hypothetical protein
MSRRKVSAVTLSSCPTPGMPAAVEPDELRASVSADGLRRAGIAAVAVVARTDDERWGMDGLQRCRTRCLPTAVSPR